MKFSSLRALAALLALAPAAAYAADTNASGTVKQIAVHYEDLNLAQESGAEILISRIEVAAKDACGGTPDTRDLKMRAFFGECMKNTVQKAVASVNSPMVSSVYDGTAKAVEISQR